MSDRATAFLDSWEFAHITIVAQSKRADEAQRLASLCRADAAKAGITEQDLEDAADGDLTGNMVRALDAAALRRLARDQWADRERDAEV